MKIKGTVSLEGIEFFARHGLYDFELEKGNIFTVDIFITSFYTDEDLYTLDGTVDYEKVFALAHKVMQEPEKLLETVAHKMAREIAGNFKGIETIKIKIRKKNPPIKNANISHSAFELEWKAS